MTGPREEQLWTLLPRELAVVFRPRMLDVAGDVLKEIQRTIPAYACPLEGAFGQTLRTGVQEAILQFIDRLGRPPAHSEERRQVFVGLGVHELGEGRNLDVLQAAYRVGARVTWRRMAEVGAEAGVPSSTLCLLAEAIFAYIDELSALSIDGHAAAQAKVAGTLERRRRRLLDLLLAEPPAPGVAIEEVAMSARWAVPARLVAVALEPPGVGQGPPPPLGPEALVDLEGSAPCLLLPAMGESERRRLEITLVGWRAAVGPEVTLDGAARSLRWAREALRLAGSGALPDVQLTWCEQHLSDLWLFKEPFLADALAKRTLGPLTDLSPKQYERLAGTLLAWLETCGNVREVADRLSIHPQTVRSRAQELEALFGNRLEDPQDRFEMLLALRASAQSPATVATTP